MSKRGIPDIEASGVLRLITGDAKDALDQIADDSVQLVVTSPPYNIGKSYERNDSNNFEEYAAGVGSIVEKLCRKISKSGSICWQVGNYVKNGEVFPLDMVFYDFFKKNGFKLRNRIIWQFNFGLHAEKRFSGRYETLLWFTKSDEYLFNLDPVRVPQLYPGKRHAAAKGSHKAGAPSGNPLGKNPSDYWVFSPEEAFRNNPVWNIPNVKANHPELTHHPCQFPHELAERCILALSTHGDTVLDPFLGAGTTAIAAIKAKRRAIGIDRCPEYVALTRQRVIDLDEGRLPLRRSGRTTATPKSTSSLAQRPIEWLEKA